MYWTKHCFVLIIVLLLGLPASLEALDIDNVQIGFDNYYRRGYWCPVKLQVTTAVKPFKGELRCSIDNTAYVIPLDIPVNQSQKVSFPIIIHSAKPDIKIVLVDERTRKEIQQISGIVLKEVPPNGFLIGVEQSLYHLFRTEFLRYSQAAQLSYFFAFNSDELPPDWRVYEALDLLVLSEEGMLPVSLQKTLATWQNALQGNVLFYPRGSGGIRLERLKPTRPVHSFNPAIKPAVYQLGISGPWRDYFKTLFGNLLVLYFIILFIIGLCWLWWRLKKYPETWFLVTLLGLIILTIVLSYLFIIPRGFRRYDIYRIATLKFPNISGSRSRDRFGGTTHQLVTNQHLICVHGYLDEAVDMKLPVFSSPDTGLPAPALAKPLYYNENHSLRIPITYKMPTRGEHKPIQPHFKLHRNGRLFFEGLSTHQLGGKLSISVLATPGGNQGYRITNQTPLHLEFCGLIPGGSSLPSRLAEVKIIYLGELLTGARLEVFPDETQTSFNQITAISRFHKLFFEYWWDNYLKTQYRNVRDNELILFGSR